MTKFFPLGILAIALWIALPRPSFAQVTVGTYHNDNLRTGWNAAETVLTPANVRRPSFGRLAVVPVDEQVDAQPLYVPGVAIPGIGTRNVVYVATEFNTVYAIDADAGTVLLSRNLGQPVPRKALPGGCGNNSGRVGIAATPVIDSASGTLYLMAYGLERKKPVYRLHALALGTLADTVPAVAVTGQQPLTDKTVFSFDAAVNRQRAALVETNGAIYAAFTSFCDLDSNAVRGWVMGWQTGTLAPLPGGRLIDRLATAPGSYFLSTVWMSGAGIAADGNGSLYFVTGNSAPTGTVYGTDQNLAESVVDLSTDLTTVKSSFTPANAAALDKADKDFGSGGVMLLPPQPGAGVGLAVAAGKAGTMYLMRQGQLGGYAASGPDAVLGAYTIGRCWCGESYFQGADGIGRVVASGGGTVTVWKVGGGSQPILTQESTSAGLPTGLANGFFTAVSSNGTQAHTQLIWAVTRPSRGVKPAIVALYAIDPSTTGKTGQIATVFSADAGIWLHSFTNANIVPLVANGRVYVASYRKLVIFGLGAKPKASVRLDDVADDADAADSWRRVTGTVVAVDRASVKIRTRAKTLTVVDTRAAAQAHRAVPAHVGDILVVRGLYGAQGILRAEAVMHGKETPDLWEPDR